MLWHGIYFSLRKSSSFKYITVRRRMVVMVLWRLFWSISQLFECKAVWSNGWTISRNEQFMNDDLWWKRNTFRQKTTLRSLLFQCGLLMGNPVKRILKKINVWFYLFNIFNTGWHDFINNLKMIKRCSCQHIFLPFVSNLIMEMVFPESKNKKCWLVFVFHQQLNKISSIFIGSHSR